MGKKLVAVEDILYEWNVNSEDELQHELFDGWEFTRCARCGRKISLLNCSYSNDQPICKDGICYG